MIKAESFKKWLEENTSYTDKVIGDTISRMKRADSMCSWSKRGDYLNRLENIDEFQHLSLSVKSQIRKAIKLYHQFEGV